MTWKPDVCIYHGDCDDGFGAAYAIWSRWGDGVAFIPGVYGKPLPAPASITGCNVLFVDFSAKRDVLVSMAAAARSVVILDHHKTAEADLREWSGSAMVYPEGVDVVIQKNEVELGTRIVAVFDMERSGAALAWDFAHRGVAMPKLLQIVEDRDLFRFQYGDVTKRVSAALRSYPQKFDTWEKLVNSTYKLEEEGEIVLRAHRANIEKFMRDTLPMVLNGHTVPAVNVPYHYASDVAHELLGKYADAPFAVSWFQRGDGQVQFSLRSTDDRLDVSEVAKAFGGGGHRNAAGFQVHPEQFKGMLAA